jgi:cation:H+ antiporter
MPLMVLVTAALYPLIWDLNLGRGDGIVLLIVLGAYLIFVIQSVEDEPPPIVGEYQDFLEASTESGTGFHARDVMWVLAGAACLVVGGYCIVEGGVRIATSLGVSQITIGLTVVAVGTSLPELATSVVAAARNESDIAVGNIIGSNIFNVAAILGVSALLEPIPISATILTGELPVVLALSMLLFPVLRSDWRIRRWEGAILLGAYVAAGIYLL